jgi:glycerophosphoryl diester phosphodiesterase
MPWKIPEKIIGHRGASAYAPENTLAAFNKALALGCRYLEFDVMVTADGEPFIFHDDNLKRTTNGQGDVGLVTAEYLRSLDAGRWFSRQYRNERIPPFDEVLKWLIHCNVQANIEIKPYPGTAEQTTIAVLSQLNRYWPEDKPLPLVSSFDLAALTLCRSLAPELPLGLLLDKWDEEWLKKAKELQCVSIHYNKRALTAARARAVKEQGYGLLVYTVNRKRQAKKLFEWGVDAIFSDYPDLLA